MIALRACETDADFEAWLAVRRAVLPNESTSSLADLKQGIRPDDLHLLAELDGELAGSGLMNRSDTGRAHLAPRVLPDKRGRGVGAAILDRIAEHATEHGYAEASSHVADDDDRSIEFARRFGFEAVRRDIQQELDVGGVRPRDVAGVEFVSIESRPELLEAAFPLAQEGYTDMPVAGIDVPLEGWLAEEATLPGGSFVALEAEQIVGYAGLMRWSGDDAKAEHGLTVVRRDRRRRGLATALKERQIAWAEANGVRTLVTYTQTGNENLQAVNARLGYVTTEGTIAFGRSLPLR